MSAEVLHMRSRPHATESIAVEKARHREQVERTAYILYERRVLSAQSNPYQAELLENIHAEVLAERDWHLAQSLVGQGNPDVLAMLHADHARLVEQRRLLSTVIELFPAAA